MLFFDGEPAMLSRDSVLAMECDGPVNHHRRRSDARCSRCIRCKPPLLGPSGAGPVRYCAPVCSSAGAGRCSNRNPVPVAQCDFQAPSGSLCRCTGCLQILAMRSVLPRHVLRAEKR